MKTLQLPNVIPTFIAILCTLIIWFIIPVPKGVDPNAWQLFALFVGTIAAIIGKAMPIGAISIIAITLVAVTGITNPHDRGAALADALSGFSNPLIWLIGSAIMISLALTKTGLGTRISYYFIAAFGKKTIGIAYGLSLADLTIAPVTPSNTARGGAIIHPIMQSIAHSFDSSPEKNTSHTIGKYLSLINYNANTITSAMFVTATAPNPLIVSLVAEQLQPNGHISWITWTIAAFVPGLLCLLLMPLIIYYLYPPTLKETPNATTFAKNRLQELGKIQLPEWITIGVATLLLCLWADIPRWLFGNAFTVHPTTTAFIGLSILLLTGVLTWDDILKAKSAWDTIVWFAALVMMASFLGKLGLISWFSTTIQNLILHLGLSWVSAMVILILVYFYTHYFFASTTAHITAMFSAFFAAGLALGAPPMLLAFLLAFSSSLMMSLTHYGTGTAPIIFGSGYVSLGEWWKTGFIMSVINLLIFFIIGSIWWKILGHW